MSRKRPKKAPRSFKCRQPQTISLATWLKMRFRGHLLHPQPPTFCGFHPLELPKRTPTPSYLGPLGCCKLQAQAQTGGCPNGSLGSSRGKKMTLRGGGGFREGDWGGGGLREGQLGGGGGPSGAIWGVGGGGGPSGAIRGVGGGGGPGGAIWGVVGGGGGGHRLPLPPLALPLTIPSP